jgi:hypothetical protein
MSQAPGKSSSYYIGSADRGEGSKVETTDLSLATPKPVYRGWGLTHGMCHGGFGE